MSGQGPRHEFAATICPYLRSDDHTPGITDPGTSNVSTPSVDIARECVASAIHFTPSSVHQSSCCMNSASYVHCPYYVKATGGSHRQPHVETLDVSRSMGLWQRVRRYLPFSRGENKRRRRVYFI